MSGYLDVCQADDVPVGSGRSFSLDGRTIALFHTESGFYAVDNSCPHRGGPLADGDLSCDEIVCPWHFWIFDLKTGRHADPRIRLVTHGVQQQGQRVLVKINTGVSDGGGG